MPKAAFIVSNMTEQRQNLMNLVHPVIPIDGYGKAFDSSIKDHSSSGFLKRDLLMSYQYCLCPENSISPGYYTEKIPEAYISGAIPITFCDSMVEVDFSPASFINLIKFVDGDQFASSAFEDCLHKKDFLAELLCTPLIAYSLEDRMSDFKYFVAGIISKALS